MTGAPLAYLSFDAVPAPKGAAVHITAFVRILADTFGPTELVSVALGSEPVTLHPWPAVRQTALPAIGPTLIDRVLHFRMKLVEWLQGQHFQAIHIRSIYEGLPIARQKAQVCDRLVFEVNGLPSIELKYRYPAVATDRELMQKLIAQEQICLAAADLILTPSSVTAAYLQSRGVEASRIRVIPNGVDLDIFPYQAPTLNPQRFRLVYFGTLSSWQGVALAVEALGLVCREIAAELLVIGPARPSQITQLQKLAQRLEIADRLMILDAMPQADLVAHLHQADAVLAPLTPNDRNLIQGCCPLKVLEAMAAGPPVIASDLPVVRELGQDNQHFLLVKPGSAKAIKDAILQLYHASDLSLQISQAARQQIERHFTWQQAGRSLIAAYQSLGINRSITV